MKNYMANKLTEEEKVRISNLASGMELEEMHFFLMNVDSNLLWEELMRRERESSEKLRKLTELILAVDRERRKEE